MRAVLRHFCHTTSDSNDDNNDDVAYSSLFPPSLPRRSLSLSFTFSLFAILSVHGMEHTRDAQIVWIG